MCKREAEFPMDTYSFEWGGVGQGGGTLELGHYIDGESRSESADLCYECAKKVLGFIRRGGDHAKA
jgi:hypothetical protein